MDHRRGPLVSARPRKLVQLASRDNFALHTTVARVAPVVEASMTAEVLADRVLDQRHLSDDGSGWLAPWRPARRVFDSRLRELAGQSVVLRTDVKDCFGSITPVVVESALVRVGCHPGESTAVGSVLSRLSEQGVRGLPVGPPASTVLANAVLVGVDRSLRGRPHLRWVDDILVFCVDMKEAFRTLSRLRRELATVGLQIAPEKTSVGALVGGISDSSSMSR